MGSVVLQFLYAGANNLFRYANDVLSHFPFHRKSIVSHWLLTSPQPLSLRRGAQGER